MYRKHFNRLKIININANMIIIIIIICNCNLRFHKKRSVLALFHCMVRYGSARLGTVRLSSGRFAFPLQFSTAIEWRDYSRIVIIAPPLLP